MSEDPAMYLPLRKFKSKRRAAELDFIWEGDSNDNGDASRGGGAGGGEEHTLRRMTRTRMD
jgi:hypothetical protein